MKRFVSWIILLGCYVLAIMATIFISGTCLHLLELARQAKGMLKGLFYLLLVILGISSECIFSYSGSKLTVHYSNQCCPSRKGSRFIVFSVIMIISLVTDIILIRKDYSVIPILGYLLGLLLRGIAIRVHS